MICRKLPNICVDILRRGIRALLIYTKYHIQSKKDGFKAPNERTDSKNEVMTRQVFINKIVKLISILIS